MQSTNRLKWERQMLDENIYEVPSSFGLFLGDAIREFVRED